MTYNDIVDAGGGGIEVRRRKGSVKSTCHESCMFLGQLFAIHWHRLSLELKLDQDIREKGASCACTRCPASKNKAVASGFIHRELTERNS